MKPCVKCGKRYGYRLAVALIVAVGVACGGAATPTLTPAPAPKAAPQPAAPAAPIAAPQASAPTQAPVATPVPKAAPTPIPAPAAKVHPGKLTIMIGEFANERFDRILAAGGGNDMAIRTLHGFLLSQNEKKQLVPGIASQWGLSADGLTWIFTIRKGVKWHDGSEVTAQDALWSLQHALDPQVAAYSTHGSAVRISHNTDRVESTGPDKVSVTTKRPEIALSYSVSDMGPDHFHIMPKRAKVHDTEEELAYDNNPIGAGFMRLEKHVRASVMKFKRFDDFYYQPKNGFSEDKRVNFQSLDLFLVPEEATRVAALRAGEADIVPASLATKKQVEAGGGRLLFGQEGVIVDVTLYGCYDPKYPCHDKRVRQALDYAIDKTVFRDQLYGGPEVFQIKGWNAVTPSTIGYTPAMDPRPFDPNKARQLLADAGYPGGKGFGKLIVNTHPSRSMPLQVEAAELAADFWRRELGLDVGVKVSDDVTRKKKEPAYELNGQIWWRENETRISGTQGGVLANKYVDPKHVTRMHEDPEFFLLAQETWGILDPDRQAEALKKLYVRFREESYQLGIGYVNIPWAVGPRVLTWQPYPLEIQPSALHTITLK